MTNKFRYLPLVVILSATPVLAQEDEEQEIRIELESGGSPAVAIDGYDSVTATPDGGVWYKNLNSMRGDAVYCWHDEEDGPRCRVVKTEG